jgi:hypothetical protein
LPRRGGFEIDPLSAGFLLLLPASSPLLSLLLELLLVVCKDLVISVEQLMERGLARLEEKKMKLAIY